MGLLPMLRAEIKLGGLTMDPDYDYCYECTGYGDNYYENEDGEMICRCFECPFFNSGGDFYE